MTGWSDIICNSAMTFINDDRMTDKLTNNPARFLREMSLFMRLAIPRFNRPVEAMQVLARRTEPKFSSFLWTANEETTPPEEPVEPEEPDAPETQAEEEPDAPPSPAEPGVKVYTGQIGFELCSIVVRNLDRYENPIETPYTHATYDPETGIVTFPEGIADGTVFDIDFYTDGQFELDLPPEMKRILGLCVQSVWENRFTSAWLPRAAKVSDRSFTPPNEANWTRAQEEKRRSLEATLNEELRLYEQNCAYRRIVAGTHYALI